LGKSIEVNGMPEHDNPVDLSAGFSCPIPLSEYPTILLAHGGGGKLTQHLIEKLYLPEFKNDLLEQLHDGAILPMDGMRLAFSTDSYVVHPLFFPGGSIGELSVNGTVNDLAMCGARPLYLSSAFIIEEGLGMETLWQIVRAMQRAAREAGVSLVTGDTKVVDRGKGDGIFITTSGVGVIDPGISISPSNVRPGDCILVSGLIAAHGVAIMSVREGLEFGTSIVSDTAPLNGLVHAMLEASKDIHVLRDPTRGGVASALNEIAAKGGTGMLIREEAIPIHEEVRAACELLGLDPLYVANEGKLLAFVPPPSAERVLEAMRNHPLGREAAIIGEVVSEHAGTVVMQSRIGGKRVVDMLSGEQLPRIC
jgi:hydrogenase expression/formation protein HypE